MTDGTDARTGPEERRFSDAELAYLREHLDDARSMASSGFVRFGLVVALVLGLAAHVVGYFLKGLPAGEPFELIADVVYALGIALWTGVVVVFFVQVLPELKRRQVRRYLGAFEAAERRKRNQSGAGA